MDVFDRWLRNIVDNDNENKKENYTKKVEVYDGWKEIWIRIQRWLYPTVLPIHTKKKYF